MICVTNCWNSGVSANKLCNTKNACVTDCWQKPFLCNKLLELMGFCQQIVGTYEFYRDLSGFIYIRGLRVLPNKMQNGNVKHFAYLATIFKWFQNIKTEGDVTRDFIQIKEGRNAYGERKIDC